MGLGDCAFDMDADNLSTGDTSQRVKFSKSLEDSIPDIGIFGTIPQYLAPIDQSRPKFSLCQKVRRLEKSMLLSVEAVATIYQLWRAAVGQSYVVIPFVCATKHCIICNYDY